MRTDSTASAELAGVRSVRVEPPYALCDVDGRHALLAELTSLVVALDSPAQVWHGASPCTVDAPGRGAAAELVRHLATTARARQTLVIAGHDGPGLPAMPRAVAEGRRHVTLDDGRLGRVLALTKWPSTLTPDWLSELAPTCLAISVHLRPLPRDAGERLLRRRLAALTSTAVVDEHAGRLSDPELSVASEAAEQLRHDLARGTTRLLHAQVLLGLHADSVAGLDDAESSVRAALAGLVADVRVLAWQQQPAWSATRPSGRSLSWPWRLVDATSAAATIPHPVGGRSCAVGTLAGADPVSGEPLLLDRFGAHNPSRLVVGTSGAGKSYAAKLELLRQRVAGASAVVIDPEGEFGRIADVLGGLTLAVGEEPAGLDPVGLACRPALAPAEGVAVLSSWAAALLGTPLSAVDLALLDRALSVVRADAGNCASTADLLAVVAELGEHPPFAGADLAARLSPAAAGTLAELFAPNPDLADPPELVVFDLRAVPGRVRPSVMACVLAWAWCETVGSPVARPRLVVVDEAHLLLDDPPAAELLAQFARRARKYGVGLEVVTQRLSDFLGNRAGEAVLANAATKLLLGCEDHERATLAAGLGLTPAEAALLRPGRRGHGLLVTPTFRTRIEIVAAEPEHVLASTGPRRR
ncbi:MAG TPA: hypothetical protein VNB24_08975 [Acidimicrobiales bacterium]|nr:hypothetical protein [Acidimicrobiales bacterium]